MTAERGGDVSLPTPDAEAGVYNASLNQPTGISLKQALSD